MKNLEVSTQPHPATEVVGGAQPGRDGDKSSAGKKAAAKRKKGQQMGTVKKPRLIFLREVHVTCVLDGVRRREISHLSPPPPPL